MQRRWKTLRAAVVTPADALTALRMAVWVPALPILKRTVPFPRLVRLMAQDGPGPREEERELRITRIARLLYRSRTTPMRDNCLERSLVAYRFLGRAGAGPELVVGVRKGEDAVHGHVWVTVDGRPLLEEPADLDPFVAVMTFQAGGARRSAGGPARSAPGAERRTEV